MGIGAWLGVAGVSGLWYLVRNSQWNVFNNADPAVADAQADDWIAEGDSLSLTSGAVRALTYVIDKFNTFMEEIETSPLLDDFRTVNEATGLLELKDFNISFPNGLTIKVIESEEVANFRLSSILDDWKGFRFRFGVSYSASICIAMRLTALPNFEINVPGTDSFNYVDIDGVIKPGSECTPPKFITASDVEFVGSCLLYFSFICDVLKSLGLTKVLHAWWSSYVLRRSLGRVRDKVSDLEEQVESLSDKVSIVDEGLAELKSDWFTLLTSKDKSKIADVFTQLKKLGYRPYG